MKKNKMLNLYKILFIAVLSLSTLIAVQVRANNEEGFQLPKLPYAFEALEPHIDSETMKIHYGKHHKAYVDNLNAAINKYPDLKGKSLEELLGNLDSLPEDIRKAVRNNGGGHYNHSFFWNIMGKGKSAEPKGQLKADIEKTFGSLDNFKAEFKKAALGQFGSGWAWLIKDNSGTLKIVATPNQDSPIMEGLKPILGLDVWEHAYYLKYQNNRGNYVDAWWNVVNWEEVEKNYK